MVHDGSLAWIYARAPRAAGISNDHLDLYKERIRRMYLDENLSRTEVRRRLQRDYGFSMSPDQFSRATNRWGFRKQSPKPRGTPASNADTITSDGQSHVTDTPSSTRVSTPAEPSKRPRSTGSTINGAGDDSQKEPSVTPERLAKRWKPARDSDGSLHLEPTEENTSPENTDDELEIVTPPENSVKRKLSDTDIPIPVLSQDLAPDMDELCAEFLASCYFFKHSYGFFAKISIPFEQKTCSGRERRARMLDLARTAKSPRTRRDACAFLQSELKTNGHAHGHAFVSNPRDEDAITPKEAFLFHRHLARMYSYEHSYAPEVHHHLDMARECINEFSPKPSLDLWTLHQFVDSREGWSMPDDLLNATLKFEKTGFVSGISLCLEWCRERLQEFLGPEESLYGVPEAQTMTVDPTSMGHWRLQWDPLTFWAHTSSLFGCLWKIWQIRSLAEDDILTWLVKDLLPGISTTNFLMIICRMIVDESRFFTPRWRSQGQLEGKPDVLDNLYKVKTRPCLHAMDSLLSQCASSQTKVRARFVHQFCNHHSWTPPSRNKNEIVQKIREELLKCLEATVKASCHRQMATPTPLIPDNATSRPSRRGSDIASLSEFVDYSALEERKKSATLEASRSNTSLLDPAWRQSSSTASRSTISLQAHRLYLSALQGNPPLARSIASRSSYSSQVSRSSSLLRFRAAGISFQKASSTATDPRSSGYSGNEPQPDRDSDPLLAMTNTNPRNSEIDYYYRTYFQPLVEH